jgi:hypothetical protein
VLLPRTAKRVFGLSTGLAAFSVALALTEPSLENTGTANMILEFVPQTQTQQPSPTTTTTTPAPGPPPRADR